VTTDTLCEAQAVATIGFVFAQPMTATSGELLVLEEVPHTAGPLGASDFWGVASSPAAAPRRSRDVESALAEFSAGVVPVPDVVALTYAKERHAHLVWTFIRRRDKAVRSEIYALERWLMDRYPGLTFDFNVVALEQHPGGTLVPDDLQGRVVMYRPRA
jgi:hypothetical protein